MAFVSMDARAITELENKISEFGAGAGQIIDATLKNEGAEIIIGDILPLIHPSGRTWRGKKPSSTVAKNALGVRPSSPMLSVTIGSTGNYNYLYFPDDGSNTKNHYGNQQFMIRGGEAATGDVLQRCVANLLQNLNE